MPGAKRPAHTAPESQAGPSPITTHITQAQKGAATPPQTTPVILRNLDEIACQYFGVPEGTAAIVCLATYLPHPELAAEGTRTIEMQGRVYMITNIEVPEEEI